MDEIENVASDACCAEHPKGHLCTQCKIIAHAIRQQVKKTIEKCIEIAENEFDPREEDYGYDRIIVALERFKERYGE